jgi:hypothetical protein
MITTRFIYLYIKFYNFRKPNASPLRFSIDPFLNLAFQILYANYNALYFLWLPEQFEPDSVHSAVRTEFLYSTVTFRLKALNRVKFKAM